MNLRRVYYSNMPLSMLKLLHIKRHEKGLVSWSKSPFVLLHVPKAAGTSLNKAFIMPDLGHLTYKELIRKNQDYLNKEVYICVYREPISRMVSTYRYISKLNVKGYSMLSSLSGEGDIDSFVQAHYKVNKADRHYFLRPVSSFIDSIPKKKLLLVNFDALGRRTQREAVINKLSEISGMEMSLPFLNSSGVESEVDMNLSLESIDIMQSTYAADFVIGESISGEPYIVI